MSSQKPNGSSVSKAGGPAPLLAAESNANADAEIAVSESRQLESSEGTKQQQDLPEWVDLVDDDFELEEGLVSGGEALHGGPYALVNESPEGPHYEEDSVDTSHHVATPPSSFVHASALLTQPSTLDTASSVHSSAEDFAGPASPPKTVAESTAGLADGMWHAAEHALFIQSSGIGHRCCSNIVLCAVLCIGLQHLAFLPLSHDIVLLSVLSCAQSWLPCVCMSSLWVFAT